MRDLENWTVLADLATFAFLIATAWLLHRRLRSRASRRFLWSVLALLLWSFCAVGITLIGMSQGFTHDTGALLNYIAYFIMEILPSLLGLACAVSLWLAVRSIAPRPSDESVSGSPPNAVSTDADPHA